jgi:hypothetical protein
MPKCSRKSKLNWPKSTRRFYEDQPRQAQQAGPHGCRHPGGDRNTIRQEARKALEALLTQEAGIDTAARLKIANQRKIILEGSQEWEILYRKYYNDEVRKLGI